jgi:hypothetical protein
MPGAVHHFPLLPTASIAAAATFTTIATVTAHGHQM